jgi:uncharacterized membrane protein
MDAFILGFLWFSAIGSALLAGLYFAFSAFIMRSLGRIGQGPGILAMNAINVDITRSLFMPLFAGTTLTGAALAAIAAVHWGEPGMSATMIGGIAYVLGMFIVTMVFNVPLNNALAAVDPSAADAATVWAHYLKEWTFWNHVRALACTVATALYIAAIAAR